MVWVTVSGVLFFLLMAVLFFADIEAFVEWVAGSITTVIVFGMFLYGARQLGWTAAYIH